MSQGSKGTCHKPHLNPHKI